MTWRNFDLQKWNKENAEFDEQKFNAAIADIKDISELEDISTVLSPSFKPHYFFNKDGKSVEIYLSDEMSSTQRLTEDIDIMVGMESGDITGIVIRRVRSFESTKGDKNG
jgi:hypothetical protein